MLVILAATACATPAIAQAPVAAQYEADTAVEEVIVTARRREENVQETPVAVTALSQQRIETANVTRLSGLSQLAPNLSVTENPAASAGANFFIRGVGATSGSLYADATVALYVDGVLIPHGGGSSFDLPDIERVEVLRGPQGTLFGRNTTGGAISIFTAPPRPEFGGKVTVGYGSDQELMAKGVLNLGQIGDSGIYVKATAGRLQRDGWTDSPGRTDQRSGGYVESYDLSLAVRAMIGDHFTADYRTDYSNQKNRPVWQAVAATPATFNYYSQSPSLGGAPFLISRDRLETYYIDPRLPDAEVYTYGHALTLNYEFSPTLAIKSITAYRILQQNLSSQLSGSAQLLGRVANPVDPAVPIEQVIPNESLLYPGRDAQYTQEFQLTGSSGELSYVAGFYYFHEKIREKLPSVITSILANGLGFQLNRFRQYVLKSDTVAGYGQVSWKPSALDGKLELTGGLRYTADKKTENEQVYASTTGFGGLPDRTNKWDNTGYTVSVSYQWTPTLMTYARVASAYKAGNYNPGDLALAYDPETAVSYEAGFKSEWLERRVRLNAAWFHTDYKDVQISQYDGANATNRIVNAGKATYQGVEVELNAILGGGFSLDLNGGYVDPNYQEYLIKDAQGQVVNVANVARFPYVAKLTGNVGLQYRGPETDLGRFTARVDLAYRSSRYFHPLDQLQVFQQQVRSGVMRDLGVNLQWSEIPIGGDRVKIRAQLFGQNLLDQQYVLQGIDLGALGLGVVSFARPRNFGVRVTAEF